MDYKNGKIYSIRSYLTDKIYIGSTCSPLAKRLYEHRANYKCYTNGNQKKYMSSYQIMEFGDEYIELIEEYPCDNKHQLLKREGQLIRDDNNCVNKHIPCNFVINEGPIIDKILYHKQYKAQYRVFCKDKIKQSDKKYRDNNKDKIKAVGKKYRDDNKDKIKQYRDDNKDKFACECGGCYSYQYKNQHYRTKKHLNFIQVKIPQEQDA
jgi:hypothetical protein